jgi:polysaccharide pyruvyl transferase CsaB
MKVPRIALVSGYYGFGNAGDEAILAGLIEGFRQRAPQVALKVISGDPASTRSEHGVEAIPRRESWSRAHWRTVELLISGGGGLIQDATSSRSALYYLGLILLARRRGVPVACAGQGIGPLRRGWTRGLTRYALSRADVVAVRDAGSRDLLQALGVRRPIEVTADLAFLLPQPGEDETAAAWGKAGLAREDRPTVGLALRRPRHVGGPGFARRLAETLLPICDEVGLRPVMVPMQRPDDFVFAEEVAEAATGKLEVIRTGLSARELLALMAGFDMVVAMRLHALVFAAICGVPPLAISYDPKVEALMGQLGCPVASSVTQLDPDRLRAALRDIWSAASDVASMVEERAAGLREAAMRNVELAAAALR